MVEMNKFLAYYESEISRYGGICRYVSEKAREKSPLLDRVRSFAASGKILEAGSGSSVNSIFLASCGYDVTCVDNDPVMLEFAKKLALNFDKKPAYSEQDLFSLNYPLCSFDVAFSHGVLEHYSDDDIRSLIDKQLDVAKTVIFSVPTCFFKKSEAINGDERFLSIIHWQSIVGQTKGYLLETFGYFFDSDNLRVRAMKGISRLTGGVFPRTKPYLGMVVRNE